MSAIRPLAALPLPDGAADAAARLADGLDAPALWWLSGYAAGLAARADAGAPLPAPARPEAASAARITIVYGSQTGNARRVAEGLARDAEAQGLSARLLRADAYPLRELPAERHLWLVFSTQGDGEPSDDARDFIAHLDSRRAPRLAQLQYAVLGLGDSSYPRFCAIGAALDARLEALGAKRAVARGDADLDIDTVAAPWARGALDAARDALKPVATVTPLRPAAALPPGAPMATRDAPFAAEVLAHQRITFAGSTRDTRHIELSLDGSGLAYEPGDALGVWPRNPARLVDALLEAGALDGGRAVAHAGDTLPLREWLTARREVTRLARPVIAAFAQRSGDAALSALLAPGNAEFSGWIERHQLLDLLRVHRGAFDAETLVATLRPLAPRLYSIASSQKVVGDEAHLTVAHLAPTAADPRAGAASHFLSSRGEGDAVPVYVEANERFRLPADPARDVLMIGAGTGVAPFRAFVQERTAIGANGRHWLFFGNPHQRTDFLYQLEWQRALKDGRLDRIDLAFSRDHARGAAPAGKLYVQHRVAQRSRELYDWIESGAHVYVCGALAMGREVDAALVDAIAVHGAMERDAATERLDALRRDGRYARDLY